MLQGKGGCEAPLAPRIAPRADWALAYKSREMVGLVRVAERAPSLSIEPCAQPPESKSPRGGVPAGAIRPIPFRQAWFMESCQFIMYRTLDRGAAMMNLRSGDFINTGSGIHVFRALGR
jgi:hypothetical protein